MMRREWSKIRAMFSSRKSIPALNIPYIPIMPSNQPYDKGVSWGNPTPRLLVGREITFAHLITKAHGLFRNRVVRRATGNHQRLDFST